MLGVIDQKVVVASRSFSVNLQDANCLEWSQDNRLALVTPSAIIVYDVETNCGDVSSACLALPQRILAAPHLPNPYFCSGISIVSPNSDGRLSDRVRQSLLPLALSAPLSYVSRSVVAAQNLPPGFDIVYTGYRRAVWSPRGAGGLHRCVLALVTSDHRLLLACGRGRRQRPCLSLGRRWAQYLAANDWPIPATEHDQDNPPKNSNNSDVTFSNSTPRKDSTHEEDLKSVGDGGSLKKNSFNASASNEGRTKSSRSSTFVDDAQFTVGDTSEAASTGITATARSAESDSGVGASTKLANDKDRKRRRIEEVSRALKGGCDASQSRDEKLIKDVEQHISRLSQLAIKLVCWCPSVTQSPETGLWESDLLHISLSGHAIVWRVTAGEREACAPSPPEGQPSTDGSKRKGRHKANPITEKEHDGSNFLDAAVTTTCDLRCPSATCASWQAVTGSGELLLVGDVLGLVKVFRVVRVASGVVSAFLLVLSACSPDRMSVSCIQLIDVTAANPQAHLELSASVTPVNSSEHTVRAGEKRENLPQGDTFPRRDSPSRDTNYEPKMPPEGDGGTREVLVVVARSMSVSALLLNVSQHSCQLAASADAYVSKMNITSISAIDAEHVYCSTRDGRLLHLSVVFHRPTPAAPPHKASTQRKRKRQSSGTPENLKQEGLSNQSPDVVGSPARVYDGVQESVDVHRVEVRSDSTEHTEVISLQNSSGKVARLNVVCTRYHGFNTSLSLRRKLVKEHNSEGASILSMATSPNAVFYATVESLRVPYDHLVMRESSRLCVNLVSGTAALQAHLTSHLLPLHAMHDFLAACRILAVEGTFLNLAPLVERLPSLLGEDDVSCKAPPANEEAEQDNLRVLQLLLWLVRLYTRLNAPPANLPPAFKSWDSLQHRLLDLLLTPWLERVVQVYHENEVWQHEDLMPLVKVSLSLMCDYLIVRGPSKHSSNAMAVLLRLGGGTREQCAVGRCELMVELSSLTEARCADGHVLPRCCVSLLPVLRPEACQLCATVLHRQPADALCGGEALCSFCGGAMEGTAVRSTTAAARFTREGSKLLPKTSLVLLNSKNRKGKNAANAQKI